MPYTKSNAKVDFESTVLKLKSLAKSTKSIKDTALSYEHKSLIYQSIIVALSSAIEEYHKSVIESMFHKMRIQGVKMGQLPLNTRLLHVLDVSKDSVKDYLFDKDSEANTILKLSGKKDYLKKLVDDNDLFDITWYQSRIVGDKKYPSEKNVIALYARLGIKDILKTLQVKSHKNYKAKLRSFNDLRTAIAHVGGKDVTFEDVTAQIEFVSDFVYMLDKELCCLCSNTAGTSCWPS